MASSRFVWTLALSYAYSQYHRVSFAVLGPSLISDHRWSAETVALTSSVFFWGLALALPIVGYSFDKFGPLKTSRIVFLLVPVGCMLLETSSGLGRMLIGQGLIGVGCAGALIGAVLLYGKGGDDARYIVKHFAVGNCGFWFASVPLGLWVAMYGIDMILRVASLLTSVLAIWFLLRKQSASEVYENKQLTHSTTRRTIGNPLRDNLPVLGGVVVVMALTSAPAVTIMTIWASLYFIEIHSLGTVAIGFAYGCLAFGVVLAPLLGQALRRHGLSEIRICLLFVGSGAIAMIGLVYFNEAQSFAMSLVLFGIISLSTGHIPFMWQRILHHALDPKSSISDTTSVPSLGFRISLVSFSLTLAIALVQSTSSLASGSFDVIFAFCAVLQSVGLIFLVFFVISTSRGNGWCTDCLSK